MTRWLTKKSFWIVIGLVLFAAFFVWKERAALAAGKPGTLDVLRSAEVLSRERDARGVARAGDAEDLADDMRTWRGAGCPVLREVAKHPPERCRECHATRDWIKELGHHQLNIPPDPYRRCPQACSCEPQHFSIAECEAGN